MDRHRRGQARQSGVGQRDGNAAPVRVGDRPSDQPFVNHAVDAPAHGRARAECLRGQVRHAQLATGARQLGQHVEVAQRQARLPGQIGRQLTHQGGMGVQQ